MAFPNTALQAWFSRLTTATFGSYLTAIFVDKSFRDKERREEKRLRNVALEELRRPLNAHLGHLVDLYSASLAERPDELPDSWREFLDTDMEKTIKFLDFSSTAPVTNPNVNWTMHSANQLEEFSQNIDDILSKHSHVIDSEMAETLQEIKNSEMIMLITTLKENRKEIERLQGKDGYEEVMQQIGPLISEDINNHLGHIKDLLQYYEKDGSPDIFPFEGKSLHSEDESPEISSARLDLDSRKERGKE